MAERVTPKYLREMFASFERSAPEAPAGYHWRLSQWNPGDGNRAQIQLIRDRNGAVYRELPTGHWPARAFADYPHGLLDGLELPEMLERFEQLDEVAR